ncbi:Hemicentin-2 [Halotydeus destructor]|nr:Hemicentin-2 [Halotydeus destructor]
MDSEGQRLDKMAGPYDEGSSVDLLCEAFGKPAPKTIWWTNGQLSDDSYFVTPHGFSRNQITLFNLTRSNLMSELICIASNTNLTVPRESSIFVDMNLKPLEVQILTPQGPLIAGQRVDFRCQTIGSRPSPRISWWKNTLKMTDILETHSTDGNLTLSTVSFVPEVSDNGKHISCRVDNPSLAATEALEDGMKLVVHYVPQLTLTLGANINRDSIKEGSDVYLECHFRANPPVYDVTWLFEGQPVISDHSKGIIIANQSLVLQKIRRQLRGKYQCIGRNERGLGHSNPLFLRIQFAPYCRLNQKMTFTVSRGEEALILCEVESDPENVTFKWFLNNSSETSEIKSFTSNLTRSVVTFSSRQGYGSLYCSAQNAIGRQKDACAFHIVPAGPPHPIQSCLVTNHSMTTLHLECLKGDDGGLKQGFYVELYDSLRRQLVANVSSSSKPNFVIESLTPGTKFKLIIYSLNAIGRSQPHVMFAATLGPPERHTSHDALSDFKLSSNIFLWMVLSCALLLLTIIVTVVVVKRNIAERATAGRLNKTSNDKEMAKSDSNLNMNHEDVTVDQGGNKNKCEIISSSPEETGFTDYASLQWDSDTHGHAFIHNKNPSVTVSETVFQSSVLDNSIIYSTELMPMGQQLDYIVGFTPTQAAMHSQAGHHHHGLAPSSRHHHHHGDQHQHHQQQQHHHQQISGHSYPLATTHLTTTAFHKLPARESPIADGCSETGPIMDARNVFS